MKKDIKVNGKVYESIPDLLKDYGHLKYGTVHARYQKGYRGNDLVRTKVTKPKSTNRVIEVNGKVYDSLSELQRDYSHIKYKTIQARYAKGYTGEDLIKPKLVNTPSNVEVVVKGKVYNSLADLQRDYSHIKYGTLQARHQKGYRGEDLVKDNLLKGL